MAKAFDPEIVRAEENLLIDCQFLIQELMSEKGVTRSQLADLAGVSKARLSQMLGVEANPTLKSVARLVHALGESVSVSRKPRPTDAGASACKGWLSRSDQFEWSFDNNLQAPAKVDKELIAVIKGENASNDNYPRVLFMESEMPLAPEPESEAA